MLPVCDELREAEAFFDGQAFYGTDQRFAQVQFVNLPSKKQPHLQTQALTEWTQFFFKSTTKQCAVLEISEK